MLEFRLEVDQRTNLELILKTREGKNTETKGGKIDAQEMEVQTIKVPWENYETPGSIWALSNSLVKSPKDDLL